MPRDVFDFGTFAHYMRRVAWKHERRSDRWSKTSEKVPSMSLMWRAPWWVWKQLATFKQAGPAFLTRDSCCYASTQDSGVVLAECRGVQRFEPLFAGPTVLRASQWRHSWHVPPKRVQRTRENKMIPIVQRMSHMLYVGLTRSSEY